MQRGRRLLALVLATGTIGMATGAVVPSPASAYASATTVAAATPTKLKVARCTAANRTVRLTSVVTKKYLGRAYGAEVTRTVALCTTKKNVTTVYSSTLVVKPIAGGLSNVKVTVGSTSRRIVKGITTYRTPVSGKGRLLFVSHKVSGVLTTTVNGKGAVRSWVGYIDGI
ncbi:MAG: hypothetical protein JWQ74_1278 [Marmoricola sp.]|nr:hypothetical protein [Marmoricola sp.]